MRKQQRHSQSGVAFLLLPHRLLVFLTFLSLEQTIRGKSSEPANRQPQCDVEQPPSGRSLDCTTRNVNHLRASDNIRENEGGAAGIPASQDGYRLAESFCRNSPKPILAPVFQNQLDRGAKAFTALFHASTLSVCAGNLRRPADEPFAIAFNDRSEFVSHGKSIVQRDSAGRPRFGGPR
jgi:hypothetical protein